MPIPDGLGHGRSASGPSSVLEADDFGMSPVHHSRAAGHRERVAEFRLGASHRGDPEVDGPLLGGTEVDGLRTSEVRDGRGGSRLAAEPENGGEVMEDPRLVEGGTESPELDRRILTEKGSVPPNSNRSGERDAKGRSGRRDERVRDAWRAVQGAV